MARELGPAACVAVTALALSACGSSGGSTGTAPAHAHSGPALRPARGTSPSLRSLTAMALSPLPGPVQDAATASLPGRRLVLLGGIDATGGSTDSIESLDGGTTARGGSLPVPQHDAQAAALGSSVYVFGGGQASSYDHILRYDPARRTVSPAGTLPTPASDVAVAAIGDTAYIVGGYTGATALDTILAWSPGSPPRAVGHLPAGLRYAAVSAAGTRLIVAGGTVAGVPTDAILSFDTSKGTLERIGRLPSPLTHASAATLEGQVIVVGGRRELDGAQTAAVLAIDPSDGRVRTVGHLPRPLSDAAVATVGDRILVAGGDGGNGPQASLLALSPRAGAGA